MDKNGHKVNVSFSENDRDLNKGYIKYQKYNAIVTYTSFYLRDLKKLDESSQYYFTFDYNKEFQQYILIVNNESGIKNLKDIKGKRFASFIANDNYRDWLDYLTLKELKKPYKYFINNEKTVQRDSALVLNLYFNKADFSVIRKSVFNDIVALNPAIKKKVSILRESKPIFFYGIGLFHKNASKKLIEGFDFIVKKGTFDNDFQGLLKLLGNVKIKKIVPDDLKDLKEFYADYKALEKKYK